MAGASINLLDIVFVHEHYEFKPLRTELLSLLIVISDVDVVMVAVITVPVTR